MPPDWMASVAAERPSRVRPLRSLGAGYRGGPADGRPAAYLTGETVNLASVLR